MNLPYIVFDEDTDYAEVEILVKKAFSDLQYQHPKCNSIIQSAKDEVICYLFNATFDLSQMNVPRYQSDIRSAYYKLYHLIV